jgi:chromosome segregation ATPase
MAGDDELERQVRKLAVQQAETRWLSLRLDDDVKEIRQELRALRTEHGARFDAIDRRLEAHGARFDAIDQTLQAHGTRFDTMDQALQAHDGRFDSTDAVLRSLHQLVGQVLERLPEEPDHAER